MMYYMNAGGPLMWVLLLMSITALTIILDRAFFFFKKENILFPPKSLKIIFSLYF